MRRARSAPLCPGGQYQSTIDEKEQGLSFPAGAYGPPFEERNRHDRQTRAPGAAVLTQPPHAHPGGARSPGQDPGAAAARPGRLIDRVGLEDAGELVALATTEQISHVFDDDLWKNERPGEEERFDTERFKIWLAVMREAGGRPRRTEALRAARGPRDAGVPPPDPRARHRRAGREMEALGEDAELTDKALSSCLCEELDSYQLGVPRSRRLGRCPRGPPRPRQGSPRFPVSACSTALRHDER